MERNEERRAAFIARMGQYNAIRISFIDEVNEGTLGRYVL
jgi:hypothetical protein